ncbi:MAG: hypothetical protein J0I11_00740 [Actinobacteria bacterium]|nr:hypothetical protein [Actinomycetota bacterium]
MSAPEVRVRVDGAWYRCDGCGNRTRPWNYEISGAVENAAWVHAETCVPFRLARLQARWDARDEALHALIEQWRAYGHARIQHAADELERAIGDGR